MAERIEVLVDGVPYSVQVQPYEYNDETRYIVNYAGNDHVFTFDPTVGRLAPIDDESSEIPDNVEREITRRLQRGGPRP